MFGKRHEEEGSPPEEKDRPEKTNEDGNVSSDVSEESNAGKKWTKEEMDEAVPMPLPEVDDEDVD